MLNPNRIRDHLANERTYLAWVRLSVALMGFGVLIARVRSEAGPHNGRGVALGMLFASAGILTVLLSTLHYFHVQRAIESESYQPLRNGAFAVAFLVVLVGVGVLALLFGTR